MKWIKVEDYYYANLGGRFDYFISKDPFLGWAVGLKTTNSTERVTVASARTLKDAKVAADGHADKMVKGF